MFLSDDFGIDLGYDTIKIYDAKDDKIYSIRDRAAVRKKGGVIAFGDEAYDLQGSLPKSVTMQVPVSAGRIHDVMMLDLMLSNTLYGKHRYLGLKPSLYFAVPSEMTEIERRAYASISNRGRFKNCDVFLIERAFADAVSLERDPFTSKGVMTVNIGASSTSATVISSGKVILNRTYSFAGNRINESIISSVRKKNDLAIGYIAAEELKLSLGSLSGAAPGGKTVYGLDTLNGLPRDGYVTSNTVCAAIRAVTDELIEALTDFVHRIPPQVLEIIKVEGICVTGGTARVAGTEEYYSERLGIPAAISRDYENAAVTAIKKLLDDKTIRDYSYIPSAR